MLMMMMMMMVKADLCERPRSAMYACNCPAVAQVGYHDLSVLIVDLVSLSKSLLSITTSSGAVQ